MRVGVGLGVAGATNAPDKIVAAPFLTVKVLPATTIGTVPPWAVERFNAPLRLALSVIIPMLAPLSETSKTVAAGRLTEFTWTFRLLVVTPLTVNV